MPTAPHPAREPGNRGSATATMSDRGDASRRALLAAAAEVFAEKGLHATSTREIAAKARQNVAAIAYYFGSKQGLYLAIAKEIAADMAARMQPLMAEIDGAGKLTAERARQFLRRMVSIMLRAILASDSSLSQFILREQQHPTEAFDILYSNGMGPLHEAMTRLLARALGRNPDDPIAAVRAHALFSQIIGFQAARALVQRRAAWGSYGAPEIQMIEKVVLANVDSVCATAPTPGRPSPRRNS